MKGKKLIAFAARFSDIEYEYLREYSFKKHCSMNSIIRKAIYNHLIDLGYDFTKRKGTGDIE